jgi:hypothetical protein
MTLINKRAMSGTFVQEGIYSINKAAPYMKEKTDNQQQAAQAAADEKKAKEYSSNKSAYKKGLHVRDTFLESNWLSDHYKIVIQFKRLRMHQDHTMTLELTNDSNGRNSNKKKKDKQ